VCRWPSPSWPSLQTKRITRKIIKKIWQDISDRNFLNSIRQLPVNFDRENKQSIKKEECLQKVMAEFNVS